MAEPIDYKDLAAKAGISRAYAWQLLNETRTTPSLELALQVYAKTGVQLGLLKGLSPDEISVMRKAAA